ncbi:Chemotaxis signal transduction protein [Hahella chejuensis KCTC 2396]|uniref:Chemotaxis signal transduction protein n=1 Tax=Hahella chejuensis (strain KCTC 2396) TaxID=349521 RepID=Q2SPH5_HAHCH|nr:chemotaxis protein CheW [Hahella chejuensis]ABC27449.1 Chemotaxis signal transduction protein [Hahella chejuensis KCTC 2396]
MSITTDPFAVLAEIEAKSKALAEGLPAQEDVIELWNGIGFSLAGLHFVAAMGEVVEILPVPRFTQIPGVKTWMQGVANVRGRLLPIMDLTSFFELPQQTRSTRNRRVLVIEQGDVFSGLIVDGVLGMQYFPVDSFQKDAPDIPEVLRPYVSGFYARSNERWIVFDTTSLVADSNFINVAQ